MPVAEHSTSINIMNNNLFNNIPPHLFREITQDFLQHYYKMYDTNIEQLHEHYTPSAMLTFNDEEYLGNDAIKAKYLSLNLNKTQHKVYSYDCQPMENNDILIMATGTVIENNNLVWSQQENIISYLQNKTCEYKYIETFVLTLNNNNNWYIQNHIFRTL